MILFDKEPGHRFRLLIVVLSSILLGGFVVMAGSSLGAILGTILLANGQIGTSMDVAVLGSWLAQFVILGVSAVYLILRAWRINRPARLVLESNQGAAQVSRFAPPDLVITRSPDGTYILCELGGNEVGQVYHRSRVAYNGQNYRVELPIVWHALTLSDDL